MAIGVALIAAAIAAAPVVRGEAPRRASRRTKPARGREPQAMDNVLESIRRKHDLPALAAAVIVEGKLVGAGAVGVRKYGGDEAVTVDDKFHLGSCTKAMTATLIGRLVERGTLRWEQTVGRSFPELADSLQPAFRDVTLEQLLAHRGGFPPAEKSWPEGMSFGDVHRLADEPRPQREAYAALMLRQAPAAMAGDFLYSNAGYAIAGIMAERAADAAWEDLMTEHLFRPLGMESAGFGPMGTPGKVDQPWQHRLEGAKRVPMGPGPMVDNPPAIGPAGIVHCSMDDWARFVSAHLDAGRGTQALLKAPTFRRLHTPPAGGDYALGWMVTQRGWGGGAVLTHSGSNNQNFCVVWMAPLKNFAVLAATNQGGAPAAQACDETAAAAIGQFLAK